MNELAILDAIQLIHTPWLDALVAAYTSTSDVGQIWILLGIVLAIIPKTRKLGAAVLIAVLLGAIVTSGILKPLIMRPRPCDVNPLVPMIIDRPHGSSFPSGHATAAFAAFGALLFSKGPKPLVIVVGIGAVLMFVGGTGLKWFVLAGAGGTAAIGAAIIIMPDLVPYAASRLSSWLDPFADPLGDGHQTIQSLYAIGSGGATGLGLGESRQKHLFVPEPQNDFIFSIVCEELGFVGACAVVGLFVLLLCRGITIAAHAPDRFGALLVVGFVVQVALQAVLNVAVVTNTIPNTGISLPFFSSGGTSLMMLLGEMGVVLGVSRGET